MFFPGSRGCFRALCLSCFLFTEQFLYSQIIWSSYHFVVILMMIVEWINFNDKQIDVPCSQIPRRSDRHCGVEPAAQGCHRGLKLFLPLCYALHTRVLVWMLVSGGRQVATTSISSRARQEEKDWVISICPFTSGEANLLQRLPIDFDFHPSSQNDIASTSWTSKKLHKWASHLRLGIFLLENNQSFVNKEGKKNTSQLGNEQGMPQPST